MIEVRGLGVLPCKAVKWGMLVCLIAAGLSSCAMTGVKVSAEDSVRARSAKRWEALIAGDFDSAYHYATPSFRKVQLRERYRNLFGNAARWTGAKVTSVVCNEDACDVQVSVEMKVYVGFTKGLPSFTVVNEKWVREEGEWWYFHKL